MEKKKTDKQKRPWWNILSDRKPLNEHDIEQDITSNDENEGFASKRVPRTEVRPSDGPVTESDGSLLSLSSRSNGPYDELSKEPSPKKRFSFFSESEKKKSFSGKKKSGIKSRSVFERFAYNYLSERLPKFPSYRVAFEQSGIPLIYESYIATGYLISGLLTLPAFLVSLLLEIRFLHVEIAFSIIGSIVLGAIVFGVTLFSWLSYPLQRRNTLKTKLDSQLAYSFGILGVLAASGMSIERLFERLAFSESNPVFAELAKRFLRNVRLFGMDTESALREVAEHSPSASFAKMLESIAIAFRTTGSIHDLVMFESGRLFEEKRSKLSKVIANLGVMAELYITLVVVGPIIFIVMMAIFGLLPSGGLPDPVFVINIIVFVGVPTISMMFVIMLDSIVTRS